MGIFLSALTAIILLAFTSKQLALKLNSIITENKHSSLLKDTTFINKTPTLDNYNIVEAEKALIRTCQQGQSWVLICKKCYALGNTNCPYPTNSFCQSAKNTDMNDASVFWSFLPNSSGLFSEIQSSATQNTNTMTDVSQMSRALRDVMNRVYDYNGNPDYKYYRPSGRYGDVCAVSSIVGN